MRLIDRFKRLSLWNKIGVTGAVASIVALLLYVVMLFIPSTDPPPRNVAQGSGNNVINTGDGDVTITGDIHVQSLDGLSAADLQTLLAQERRLLGRELGQGDGRSEPTNNGSSTFADNEPRKWLPNNETAVSIIESLKDTKTLSEHRKQARSLYETRWIPDPGWLGIVHGSPAQHGNDWLVTISVDDSRVFVLAITTDPSGDQWRDGQKVKLVGRIKEVRYNPFIYVDNASLSLQ